MDGIAVILIASGVWCFYCGFSGFRPIRMSEAVLSQPGSARGLIAGAHAYATQSLANAKQGEDQQATPNNSGVPKNGHGSGPSQPDPHGFVQADITPYTGGKVASNPKAEQSYANTAGQRMFGSSWNATQMADLIKLWNRESGWRVNAYNASSGATGIPQSLPASKMKTAGSDYLTNPATQINWGLSYIKNRYGSVSAAWQHETTAGWY